MKVLIAAAVLLLAGYLGIQALYPSLSFRYRLTVEVETPEGVRTGSSVVEITESRGPKIGDAPSSVMTVKGEAVIVDLGQRGLLFALLKGDSYQSAPAGIVYTTFPPPNPYGSGAAMPDNLRRYAKSTEKAHLPTTRIPWLIRFRDIADPKTVQRVDSANLAEIFGAGVQLRRTTLELTQDSVTSGIQKVVPWSKNESALGEFWLIRSEWSSLK